MSSYHVYRIGFTKFSKPLTSVTSGQIAFITPMFQIKKLRPTGGCSGLILLQDGIGEVKNVPRDSECPNF